MNSKTKELFLGIVLMQCATCKWWCLLFISDKKTNYSLLLLQEQTMLHVSVQSLIQRMPSYVTNTMCNLGWPFYRPFLEHCTLTNKAMVTIWRALSKPPKMRQGPDLRLLWLLIGTPSAIRPELASRWEEHSLSYSDVTIYIFLICNIYYLCCFCIDFMTSGSIFKVCPFDYTAVAGSGNVGSVNRLTTLVGWL